MPGYQGWENYETWAVKLWIDNEEGSYNYWNEVSEACASVDALARRLKEEFEDSAQDVLEAARQECSLWSDLLTSAVQSVNWDEIATAIWDETGHEEEDEEDEETEEELV